MVGIVVGVIIGINPRERKRIIGFVSPDSTLSS